MHPRNPYSNPPDFSALAEAYPDLKPHIISTQNGVAVDFTDEASQRRLTEAILSRDFGISIELPLGRLCPPVPNRLNYILWLEDVIEATSIALDASLSRVVRGLDVGTGASAIYPLLGCAVRSNWVFTGTEIDELSLQSARRNVNVNGLESKVSVVPADPSEPIFLPLFQEDRFYDFTMCNPPFYSSRDEVLRSAEAKEFGPNAVCTGADIEMITPGGEAVFVGKMVEESLKLREKCRWYTSMLGKLSSVAFIIQLLRDNKIENYAISELVQGRTRRWVVAWSFGDVHLPDSLCRFAKNGPQNIMPARNSLHQSLPMAKSIAQGTTAVHNILNSIASLTTRSILGPSGATDTIVSAAVNTWSRAARRKRQVPMEAEAHQPMPQLVCRVRIENCHTRERGVDGVQLMFDWMRGNDRGLFESFASHVERRVMSVLCAGGPET
ncbi:S-adenosyl-L-methionine dependent methyltransferase [Trametes meyenii]|nr:S-adenosyl-L-methionine dependent methyltransferase [Trametes meyenii]